MSNYNYILEPMSTYLSRVKNNVDNWIVSNNYQTYQFGIYAFIIFVVLYFGSSFISFFTRIPFLILFSVLVAYLLLKG